MRGMKSKGERVETGEWERPERIGPGVTGYFGYHGFIIWKILSRNLICRIMLEKEEK